MIRSLMVLMLTSNEPHAGTEEQIAINIWMGGSASYWSFDSDSSAQSDQDRGQANLYVIRPEHGSFTKRAFDEVGRIELKLVREEDVRYPWLPESFFVFGLDTGGGRNNIDIDERPTYMVPLVHIPNWTDWLDHNNHTVELTG